jgi:hypothetical protein
MGKKVQNRSHDKFVEQNDRKKRDVD